MQVSERMRYAAIAAVAAFLVGLWLGQQLWADASCAHDVDELRGDKEPCADLAEQLASDAGYDAGYDSGYEDGYEDGYQLRVDPCEYWTEELEEATRFSAMFRDSDVNEDEGEEDGLGDLLNNFYAEDVEEAEAKVEEFCP